MPRLVCALSFLFCAFKSGESIPRQGKHNSSAVSKHVYKVIDAGKANLVKLNPPCLLDANAWLSQHPRLEVQTSIESADMVWYQAECDTDDINKDVQKIINLGKPAAFIITGDQSYVPDVCDNQHSIFFVSRPNAKSNCKQVQIHYYRNLKGAIAPRVKILLDLKAGEGKSLHNRTVLASFLGSSWTFKPRVHLKLLNKHLNVQVQFNEDFWAAGQFRNPEYVARVERILFQNLRNSVFGLCPRGNGISSMRLVETILNGGIPVLMNDEMQPFGQDMLDFAVRWDFPSDESKIPESLDSMYAHLSKLAADPAEMQKRYKNMFHFAMTYLVPDLKRVQGPDGPAMQAMPFSDKLLSLVDEYFKL